MGAALIDFIEGAASNLLANIVFWVGLGLLVWFVTSLTRGRFRSFFNLDAEARLCVFLSNLWSPERSGRPVGFTLSLHEFHATQSIARLVSGSPMRLPESVRGLVDGIWLRNAPQASFEPASETSPMRVGRTTIVLGAAARNTVRSAYVDRNVPQLVMTHELHDNRIYDAHLDDEIAVVVARGDERGFRSPPGYNLAILEKMSDPERDASIFFCLGIRADGTRAACEYLVRHWARLQREFKSRDFALCLGFPKTEAYLEQYVEPVRLKPVPPPEDLQTLT